MINKITAPEEKPIHPSEILSDILNARGIDKQRLKEYLQPDTEVFDKFMRGEIGLNQEIAKSLSALFNTSLDMWLGLQEDFDRLTKLYEDCFNLEVDMYDQINYDLFYKAKAVREEENAFKRYMNLLAVFEEPSLENLMKEDLAVACKSNPNEAKNWICENAWIKLAVYIAKSRDVKPYVRENLESHIAELSAMVEKNFSECMPRIYEIFNDCGIALVFLPAHQNSKINGAVKWISNDKVMLALNDNENYTDKLWFALFHEIKHVLQEQRDDTIVQSDDYQYTKVELEQEADRFSREILIPNDSYERFISSTDFSEESFQNFAKEINRPVGIVIGRLQHDDYLDKHKYNHLRNKSKFVFNLDASDKIA